MILGQLGSVFILDYRKYEEKKRIETRTAVLRL